MSRRTSRTRAVGLRSLATVGVAVLVGLTGCEPVPYTGAPWGTKVVVLGDSVTHVSTTALRARLEVDRQAAVSGVANATYASRLADAKTYAATSPAVAVVMLGTNDASRAVAALNGTTDADLNRSVAAVRADARQLLTRFAGARCVVVGTVNTAVYDATYRRWAERWNAEVRTVAPKGMTIRVADWDAAVAAYYATGSPEGELTTDTVHPTPFGQQRFAEVVDAAVDDCPSGPES